eukprot:CAMPEP_0119548434 /NCGR_PEP_ID=MMETSP1352-20130426/2368_1 /TAXON_ID=265584 /ORGANISM="Stauroneis constricta, Strain CCMP1120" /LENGTH=319 /DNA_ID=CAMNT_0007593717 /DNA_START=88 /DNA_END=1047 /DNA_ORIENTATION=-
MNVPTSATSSPSAVQDPRPPVVASTKQEVDDGATVSTKAFQDEQELETKGTAASKHITLMSSLASFVNSKAKVAGLMAVCAVVISVAVLLAAPSLWKDGKPKPIPITFDASKATEADRACVEAIFGDPLMECACFDDLVSVRCKCDGYAVTQLKGGDCDQDQDQTQQRKLSSATGKIHRLKNGRPQLDDDAIADIDLLRVYKRNSFSVNGISVGRTESNIAMRNNEYGCMRWDIRKRSRGSRYIEVRQNDDSGYQGSACFCILNEATYGAGVYSGKCTEYVENLGSENELLCVCAVTSQSDCWINPKRTYGNDSSESCK